MNSTPYPNRWKALVVLALSLLIISLDNTILNTALPSLRDDLGASGSGCSGSSTPTCSSSPACC